MLKGLHPSFSFLLVIDLSPAVAGSEVVSLTVLVAHAVIVLDTVVEEKLGAFFACFPPICIRLAPFDESQIKDSRTMVPRFLVGAFQRTRSTSDTFCRAHRAAAL